MIWLCLLACLAIGIGSGADVATDLVDGMPVVTTMYDDDFSPSVTSVLIGCADARGGSRGGSFSSGSRSSFSGSRSSGSSFGSKSSVFGKSPSAVSSKSMVYGKSSVPVSSVNGKPTLSGSYSTKAYVPGTAKVTSTSPKVYVPGSSYKKYGHDYNQVYYGSGFDLNSLLLLGFIMSHDDNGKVIYLNNATGEMVKSEDIESSESAPGMDIFAGLIGLGICAYRRRNA